MGRRLPSVAVHHKRSLFQWLSVWVWACRPLYFPPARHSPATTERAVVSVLFEARLVPPQTSGSAFALPRAFLALSPGPGHISLQAARAGVGQPPTSAGHIFETQSGLATMLDGIRLTLMQHLRIGCVLSPVLGRVNGPFPSGPSDSGLSACSAARKGRKQCFFHSWGSASVSLSVKWGF